MDFLNDVERFMCFMVKRRKGKDGNEVVALSVYQIVVEICN